MLSHSSNFPPLEILISCVHII